MKGYPAIGDLVWVNLQLDEHEPDENIKSYDGHNALGYVVQYMSDVSQEIYACIHILEWENLPVDYDYYHRYISVDACTIDRPLEDYSITWIAKNSEDCPL
jgi:hypothetical protein